MGLRGQSAAQGPTGGKMKLLKRCSVSLAVTLCAFIFACLLFSVRGVWGFPYLQAVLGVALLGAASLAAVLITNRFRVKPGGAGPAGGQKNPAMSEEPGGAGLFMPDAMNDGMAIISRDGTIVSAGRAIAGRAGVAQEACVGASIRDMLPESCRDETGRQYMRRLARLFDTGVMESFEECVEGRWYDSRLYPLYSNGRAAAAMLLATDITDKKKAAEETERYAAFERTVLLLSQDFINTPMERLDGAVNRAMEQVARYCGLERSSIYIYDWDKEIIRRLYGWDSLKNRPKGEKSNVIPFADIPDILEHHKAGKPYFVNTIEETPVHSAYRRTMRARNSYATANFPLIVDGRILGLLSFSTCAKRMSWTEKKLAAIEIFCQMISNVLMRKERIMAILQAEERERHHVEFERIILSLARNFINMPLSEYRNSITQALGIVGEKTGADRVTIYRYDWDAGVARHMYEWDSDPAYYLNGRFAEIPVGTLAPVIESNRKGLAYIQRGLPHSRSGVDEAADRPEGVTGITFPLFRNGSLYGTIGLAAYSGVLDYEPNEALVRIFSEMVSNMLQRIDSTLELQEANESNRLLLDSTCDGVVMVDHKGTVLSSGRVFAAQFGKTPEQIVGMNMRDINSAKQYQPFSKQRGERIQRVFNTGTMESYEDCRDGIWLATRICPVMKNGKVVAVTLFSTDITDKKKAEEEACLILKLESEAEILQQKEQDYLEILDSSSDGSWIYDIQKETIHYSEHWMKKIGAEHVSQEQRPAYTKSILHPDDREMVRAALIGAFSSGKSKHKLEYRMKTADGSYIWVLNQCKILYDEGNQPLKVYGALMDITGRKKVEQALKENELLMRTFMDSASDFMFIKDKEGRVVMVNKAYGRAFGMSVKDVIGKNDFELYDDKELVQEIRAHDQLVMETNRMLICQESVMTRYGKRTYSLSKVPWRDTDGHVLGILGTAHDITEFKNARDELQRLVNSLKRSNECIELLYEISDSLIGCTAPQHKIDDLCGKVMRFLNCDAFFNYLTEEDGQSLRLNASSGFTEEQKLEIEWLPFGVGACGRTAQTASRRVIESIQELDDPETELIRSMGIRAYACHPMIEDGRVIGTLAFCTCLRDSFSNEELSMMKAVADSLAVAVKRKRAEEALRQNETLLRTIINGTKDLVFLEDRESHILMANEATAKAFGFSLADLIGKGPMEYSKDPELAKSIMANDRQVMDSDTSVNVEEHMVSGMADRIYLSSKSPWHDEQGNVIGLIDIARDITDRIEMEKKLRHTAQELAEKNALITDFFINVSHEFRTPISVLQLAIEIIQEHDIRGSLNAGMLKRNLEIIRLNTRRLARLVGNLLDITKIDAGFMRPKFTYVDIVALLQKMVDSVKPYAARRKLNMTFEPRAGRRVVRTDAEFVERIVINLLSNAIKYTQEGGMVRVSCQDSLRNFVISVKDDGDGIPDNMKEIIFDRFRQVNNSLARSSEGCGIGLALAKSLAELLDGRIWVESEQGCGSTFFVELPNRYDIDATQSIGAMTANLQNRIVTELSDISL